MEIGSIGDTGQNSTDSIQRAGLGQEDFLKILLAQLTFQDPLKPMDNQEFIAQMAQFTSLEQTNQLNDKLDTLLTIQTANQSIGLLNKTVNVNGDSGLEAGTVIAVNFQEGVPILTVKRLSDGASIPNVSLSQISTVITITEE